MRRILVVDNEPVVLELLIKILKQANWDVTAARSGSDALGLLAQNDFHTILCDLDLGTGKAAAGSGQQFIYILPDR